MLIIMPLLIGFFIFVIFSDVNEIAITFDDLPGLNHQSAETQRLINDRILQALSDFEVTATGFVNEGTLYNNGHAEKKVAILKSWVNNGHQLGNHTYSHLSLTNSNIDEYQKDVIRGATISRKLMNDANMPYRYFRHPYLHTGATDQIRTSFESFLIKENYILAPVTIDTEDWKFNLQLIERPHEKDKIITEYLAYTQEKFASYKIISKKMFGRNIRHIWLLHINLINSYAMEDLLKIVNSKKYKFVTLDRALEDKVYRDVKVSGKILILN